MGRKRKVEIPEEYMKFSDEIRKQCEYIDIKYIQEELDKVDDKYFNDGEWEFIIDSVKNLYKYIFGQDKEVKLSKRTVSKNKFYLSQRLRLCKKLCNEFLMLDLSKQPEDIEILFKVLLREHFRILVENEIN